MPKVEYKDLEKITDFLDSLAKAKGIALTSMKATDLSKMIKDKYTEIRADYDQ